MRSVFGEQAAHHEANILASSHLQPALIQGHGRNMVLAGRPEQGSVEQRIGSCLPGHEASALHVPVTCGAVECLAHFSMGWVKERARTFIIGRF